MSILSVSQNPKPEIVPEDVARRAEPTVRAPDELAIQEVANAHAKEMHTLQRGLLGWCIGSGSEKAGNVATLTILGCLIFILFAFLRMNLQTEFESFYKLLTTLLGPVGLALGYLFGSRDSSK